MLFNSYVFMLLFLPCMLLTWWGLGQFAKTRLSILVAASYLFYGWWHWEFTLLLMFSTLVDYYAGLAIQASASRRTRLVYLGVSLVSNLGVLAYFKYAGFLAQSMNAISAYFQFGGPVPVPDIILPVGISFYTFQTLTYSIDLYRREIQPAKSLIHFAAYVSMFPQLIAGPIVRFSDVEDQMQQLPVRPDWCQMVRGIEFFVLGMAQKILLADTIAKLSEPLLQDSQSLQFASAWLALLGYSCQLYFDFSGYSNMAIGLGHMLGFQFPQNFNSPYQATNIQDFWRRWHMTLSSFLRDYLYIPLGGSRGHAWLLYRNLLIVMILGGLWHGAGFLFILWGIYHGLLLCIHAAYRRFVVWRMPRIVGVAATFLCVILGWVMFRSVDMAMARDWYQALLGMRGFEPLSQLFWMDRKGIIAVSIGLGICWFGPNISDIKLPRTMTSAVALAMLLFLCILCFDAESPFLYFQF